jgi:alpha-beta hydrolase superfamily lysophospholipase
MRRALDFTTTASRHAVVWALRAVALFIAGCLVLALGFTLYAVNALPDLQPWHTTRLTKEFDALRHARMDFAGYLALEQELFDEAAAVAATWRDRGEAFEHSRFNPTGAMQQLADGAPYNRSFRLTPAAPVGGALLVHGLTDSPYSVRAVAEVLFRSGFEVTVLRLPGHGTLPSMMTEMHARDWQAAVALAARDVAAHTPAGAPFYIGGYSTGASLALHHTLRTLKDDATRRPTRVLLLSPAIQLTPAAALANVIDFFSIIPVPVLEKVRWQEVVAEYDPYKFNSFPVNASRQVNRATNALQSELVAAAADGRIGSMPPVVTWQSVVDSTVGSAPTVDVLYARLNGAQHRLVMFDVNRSARLASVQRPGARELIERVARGERRYTLELVSNASPEALDIALYRLAPGQPVEEVPTGLAWPAELVSLGHVALPFPPDDPVYGIQPGSGRAGIPSLGSLLLRGESGALTVSLGSLTRVRSNPFWPVIESQIEAMAAADVLSAGATPSRAAR